MKPRHTNAPTNAELDIDKLAQLAMWGYIDQAQQIGHAHDRLVRASRAAALAVVGELREWGMLRYPITDRDAAHGTPTGYSAGCRCEFCVEASSTYERALYHNNKTHGHNKVRA